MQGSINLHARMSAFDELIECVHVHHDVAAAATAANYIAVVISIADCFIVIGMGVRQKLLLCQQRMFHSGQSQYSLHSITAPPNTTSVWCTGVVIQPKCG